MDSIVIIDAKRTAIGKFRGQFAEISSVQLGTQLVKQLLANNKIDPESVDQFIFGNVYQAGSGQNVARQIGINAGGRVQSTGMTINQVCGSGMKAVHEATNALLLEDADIVVCGGVESMSNAPFYSPRVGKMETSEKQGDTLFQDGLIDAFANYPMGMTAENVAVKYDITREMQDEYALKSQKKAAESRNELTKEILPIQVGDAYVVKDEAIRGNSTMEGLANLKPAFEDDGTVTAGNSSPLNDGAAAMIMMRKETADKMGLDYVAEITGYVEEGIDPRYMGYAPYYAINKFYDRYDVKQEDYDLFEINEAFAAPTIAVARDLNIPEEKLNVFGGAIALGHPIGATGARLIVSLINSLQTEKKHTGIASLCIGGGMGMAIGIKLS
ncbi:thiolase family protein [Companilactobacillus mishanensis]|uniref:acetyl-CoA C-acetyltransferase n=1 Tax=Companilactobacillus mishanensis TaxID=2486008 RepID=A0A5P0ZFH2_9LACO|nr:thiolase family protein [Companilactobacillus mishanensis]MQS51807.1 thiolase family protein [Companilactobacillus mishanensis]MQS89076.1 thiolase family protein [Companilactobacillus mishanensis]